MKEKIEKKLFDNNARFSNVLGADYNLRSLSMSYHEKFQDIIKNSLKRFAEENQEAYELNVLEAGCGTGITTIRVLEADPRIKVIAVDNEEKTIKQAQQALKDFENRIDFRQGDILAVLKNIEDASIDAFASALTIHNFPDDYRKKVFHEVSRVLKTKGLFINADKYAMDDPEAHSKSLQEQINSFDIYDTIGRSDIKKAWTEHYKQDEYTKITEKEQIKMLEDLGFENIKVVFRESMEAVIKANKK